MSDQQQATIAAGDEILTLINTFTCADARQGELVSLMQKAIADIHSRLDGFISASVHASLDHTRVVTYMQWRTVDDFDRAELDPKVRDNLAQVLNVAESADPRLYRVTSVVLHT